MKNLFSTLIIAITMFIANQILGQEVNGVATYQSKTKLNINFEDTRIPPERVAHIKEMMKNQLEKKYTLVFNKNASIFKEEEKLDQPNVAGGGFRFRMAFLGNNDILYKNITRKELIKETEFSGKKFLISDSLPTYKWKLAQESKMIGSNLCFKATTVIQQPKAKAFKFGPPPPPNSKEAKNDEKDNIQSMENILVTAWYT
ncbi:MAG: GLPGLI family protein, partial [Lutibacter sp.]